MPQKPFVDFRNIRSRITMKQVLQHYNLLATFKRTGHILIGQCPIHKGPDTTQFHVDPERNIWTCYSECTHSGNSLDLIARMESISIYDAAIKACEWFDIPMDEVQLSSLPPDEHPIMPPDSIPRQTDQPQITKPHYTPKRRFGKLPQEHPYLAGRGLNRETIAEFGLEFCSDGPLKGRIIIPVHNARGELVGHAGRFPGEPAEDTPKYALSAHFDATHEIFNLHRAIREQGTLVIVKGFFDAMKLYQEGCRKVVALIENTMSDSQEALLRNHTDRSSQILIVFNGQTNCDGIALRLARFCYVKTHVFDKESMQAEHFTSAELNSLIA